MISITPPKPEYNMASQVAQVVEEKFSKKDNKTTEKPDDYESYFNPMDNQHLFERIAELKRFLATNIGDTITTIEEIIKTLFQICNNHISINKYDVAIRHANELIFYLPTQEITQTEYAQIIDAYTILADCYYKIGDYKDSLTQYEKLLEIVSSPQHSTREESTGIIANIQSELSRIKKISQQETISRKRKSSSNDDSQTQNKTPVLKNPKSKQRIEESTASKKKLTDNNNGLTLDDLASLTLAEIAEIADRYLNEGIYSDAKTLYYNILGDILAKDPLKPRDPNLELIVDICLKLAIAYYKSDIYSVEDNLSFKLYCGMIGNIMRHVDPESNPQLFCKTLILKYLANNITTDVSIFLGDLMTLNITLVDKHPTEAGLIQKIISDITNQEEYLGDDIKKQNIKKQNIKKQNIKKQIIDEIYPLVGLTPN
jgi:tetratricopeptide (TPR) repeat protein